MKDFNMKRIALLLILLVCSLCQAANEIRAFDAGATTCYTVVREIDGDVWYVAGNAFEVWGTGARTADDYDIALTDKTGGFFVGTMDTDIGAGYYYLVTHQQAAGSPADTDPAVFQEYGYWSGTVWRPNTLKTIEDKVGVPVALDGAAATLGGMLTRIVDDNDGASFNAERESLYALRERGDRAWTTGVGASPSKTYQITTCVITVGDTDFGTSANVNIVDGVYFTAGEIATTTKLEVDATFTSAVGMNPVSVNFWGYYYGGAGHYMRVLAYNYIDSTFEEVGTIGIGTVVGFHSFQLGHAHINPTTGAMAVKFLHSSHSGITSHYLAIDKVIVTLADISLIAANVTAILEDTGTTIPDTITTAQNDLDTITGSNGVLIDTDAIDADAIKADAVTEIQDGLATATNVTDAHSITDGLIGTVDGIVDTIAIDVAGLDGSAMIGTNGAITSLAAITDDKDSYKATGFNTVTPDAAGTAAGLHATTDGLIGGLVVPDVAGTAATLHGVTNGKIDTIDGIVDTIAIDVAGLDGDAMATGFNTVTPDAAGTAAALHTTTNALVNGLNDISSSDITTALNTYDPATNTEMAAYFAALNDITVAQIMAATIEGSITFVKAMRGMVATNLGKASGGGTTSVKFRDTGDTKNVIEATVDASGNRTAMTLNLD